MATMATGRTRTRMSSVRTVATVSLACVYSAFRNDDVRDIIHIIHISSFISFIFHHVTQFLDEIGTFDSIQFVCFCSCVLGLEALQWWFFNQTRWGNGGGPDMLTPEL